MLKVTPALQLVVRCRVSLALLLKFSVSRLFTVYSSSISVLELLIFGLSVSYLAHIWDLSSLDSLLKSFLGAILLVFFAVSMDFLFYSSSLLVKRPHLTVMELHKNAEVDS
jgi:hypothetical protein